MHCVAASVDDCSEFKHADMTHTPAAALFAICTVLSAVVLRAHAFSGIVAFGDSLTDDCTMGASQVVDNALSTDQVHKKRCPRAFAFLALAAACLSVCP